MLIDTRGWSVALSTLMAANALLTAATSGEAAP